MTSLAGASSTFENTNTIHNMLALDDVPSLPTPTTTVSTDTILSSSSLSSSSSLTTTTTEITTTATATATYTTVRSITPVSNASMSGNDTYPLPLLTDDSVASSRSASTLSTYTHDVASSSVPPNHASHTGGSRSTDPTGTDVAAPKLPKLRFKFVPLSATDSNHKAAVSSSSSSTTSSILTDTLPPPSTEPVNHQHTSSSYQTPLVNGTLRTITSSIDPSFLADKEVLHQLQDFTNTLNHIIATKKREDELALNNDEDDDDDNNNNNDEEKGNDKYDHRTSSVYRKPSISQNVSENEGTETTGTQRNPKSITTTVKKRRSNSTPTNSRPVSDTSETENEESRTQQKKVRRSELRFTFPDSDDDLGENENAQVDRDETFTMPPLRILRNITRKSTNSNPKSRKYAPVAGSIVHIEGSNSAVAKSSLSHTIAHRLSEGCIVDCDCCKLAYETYWNRPRKQRKMKRLKVGIEHGYIDICDSDMYAVEAFTGLSSDIVRQSVQTARSYQTMDTTGNDNDERLPMDTISGRIPEPTHQAVRERLLADLAMGRLTASIDWPRRVVWLLVCGEWEIRNRREKESHTSSSSSSKAQTSTVERKVSSRRNRNSSVVNDSAEENDTELSESGNEETKKDHAASHSSTTTVPSTVQVLQRRKPGRPGGKSLDHAEDTKSTLYRRPFRIKIRDVRAYLPLGEPQYAPTFDDDEIETNHNETTNNSSGSSTNLSASDTSAIPSSIDNATATATSTLVASSSSSTGPATATTASSSTRAHSSRSLRSSQGSLSNISLKHGKCPFTETDAIHALIRMNYKAPHYIDILEEKGRCVFAGGYLPRGAFFCEYGGQLLNEEEARLREARYNREGGNYGTGCYSYYFRHPVTRIGHCVDATAERKDYGIGRLLSHSMRHPNLACKVYIVDGVPRLVLHTKIDILFGDEMKYDYGERSEIVLAKFEWLRD